MKKILLTVLLMAALCLTVLTGCNLTPDNDDGNDAAAAAVSVFTVDINPGVRFYLAADNTVIEVEATNEDGESVVAELEVEGVDYDAALEAVIDEAVEQGFADEEEPSVLISVEKQTEEIKEELSAGINDKINKAMEKHGKHARVIEQELDKIGEDVKRELKALADKYNISEGKANVIEKIRGEFPELDEGDLAKLDMSNLGLLLGETGDDVKEHFKKFEKALNEIYVGREAALDAALADISTEELAVTAEDVEHLFVKISREDGKMVYEVEFIYGGNEYEFEIDAELGDILDKEVEEAESFDVDEKINEFFDENRDKIDEMLGDCKDKIEGEIDKWIEEESDKYRDEMIDAIFGKGEHKDDGKEEEGKPEGEREPIGRTEAISAVLEALGISRDNLKESKVKVLHGENGTLVSVRLETKDGNKYSVLVEAFSGTLISAELNGVSIEISASSGNESAEESADTTETEGNTEQ